MVLIMIIGDVQEPVSSFDITVLAQERFKNGVVAKNDAYKSTLHILCTVYFMMKIPFLTYKSG